MMKRLFPLAIFAFASLPPLALGETYSDSIRDHELDIWSSYDVRFSINVMSNVLEKAGVDCERLPFRDDGTFDDRADIILSAFRTEKLAESYDFPLQPLGRLHYALYTTPDRAVSLLSSKITDWPTLRVGFSPVSQGDTGDREGYFAHAQLSPEYIEFAESGSAVEALRENKIDVLFLYTPVGKRPEGLTEIVPIGERNMYFAVRKTRHDLYEKLVAAYRNYYIDNIDDIDSIREEMLGIPKPKNRVRVAAYVRGNVLQVSPDGERSGVLANWMRTICGHTHWSVDYVYGDYDQCMRDVESGRLDILGGVGFSAGRRRRFLYPHTSIGMLRVYLWVSKNSPYNGGDPSFWTGMRVGLLRGTPSAARAKRQFGGLDSISYSEFDSSMDLLAAYRRGEIDAIVDAEMPEFENSRALHLFASNPMYICVSNSREDIFNELEIALEAICEDFPRYSRMVDVHHYGIHSEMSDFTFEETEWLREHANDPEPIAIDFSPWPFPVIDPETHEAAGFVKHFLGNLSEKTGLKFVPQTQTGIQTAEAKFLRGETKFWVPFPEHNVKATYGAISIYSMPVPQSYLRLIGIDNASTDFELLANPSVPPLLVSIIRKVLAGTDPADLQDMFVEASAERQFVHRVFGKTRDELKRVILEISVAILGVAIIFTMTMLLLLRREARRANRAAELAEQHAAAKTRFLAMMSHELRTPLNAVIGFAEFLSKDNLPDNRRHDYIDGILLSSNALLELINDILDLSKLDAGAMEMRKGKCDIDVLLREIPAIFGYRVRRHGVKLVVEAPQGVIPVVELSQQALRQILINLIGNSAKFTDSGEIKVKVRWNSETRTLSIDISDTGCGISDDKMAKLFDPFVQDIAGRMRENAGQIKGTGLGLPIVKRMVDAAQGTITATSTVNVGTTFHIEIPDLKVIEGPRAVADKSDAVVTMTVPERVLVVDDMVVNRKVLGIHLSNIGVKDIRYAESGNEALDVMKDWLPDVVLSDMWMPNMDGSQLAEAMRQDHRLARVPIVAVTADVDVGSTYDLSLFKKVLSKPVNGDKLRALFGEL